MHPITSQQSSLHQRQHNATHIAGVQPHCCPAVSPLLQQFCTVRPKHSGSALAGATALAAAGGGAGGLHCDAKLLASAWAAAAAPPKPCAVATVEASASSWQAGGTGRQTSRGFIQVTCDGSFEMCRVQSLLTPIHPSRPHSHTQGTSAMKAALEVAVILQHLSTCSVISVAADFSHVQGC
jgi:hypothetical protein